MPRRGRPRRRRPADRVGEALERARPAPGTWFSSSGWKRTKVVTTRARAHQRLVGAPRSRPGGSARGDGPAVAVRRDDVAAGRSPESRGRCRRRRRRRRRRWRKRGRPARAAHDASTYAAARSRRRRGRAGRAARPRRPARPRGGSSPSSVRAPPRLRALDVHRVLDGLRARSGRAGRTCARRSSGRARATSARCTRRRARSAPASGSRRGRGSATSR